MAEISQSTMLILSRASFSQAAGQTYQMMRTFACFHAYPQASSHCYCLPALSTFKVKESQNAAQQAAQPDKLDHPGPGLIGGGQRATQDPAGESECHTLRGQQAARQFTKLPGQLWRPMCTAALGVRGAQSSTLPASIRCKQAAPRLQDPDAFKWLNCLCKALALRLQLAYTQFR